MLHAAAQAVPNVNVDSGGIDWLTPVATVLAVFIGGIINYVVQARLSDRRWEKERLLAAQQADDERSKAAKAADAERTKEALARVQAVADRADESVRRDAEERRVRHAEERAAALVLQGDWSMVASRLHNMTVDPRWFGFYTFPIPNRASLQLTIARADRLTPDDWEAITQSALELAAFEDAMRRAVSPDGPHRGASVLPMSGEQDQESIRVMWSNATKAYNVLAKLSGIETTAGLLHADT